MSTYVEGFRVNGNTITLRWGDFLALVLAKKLAMQYSTGTDAYTIWAVDGPLTYLVSPLVFAGSSANYPFPFPDGYTAAQNNTDVGVFVATYQASANTVALSSVGATGASAPLSASLTGIIVGGNLVGVSSSNPLPISGSITATNASIGATGAAVPADATFIGGLDPSGNLNAPGITLASTAAIATQQAFVTALSPNTPLPAGSNTIGSVNAINNVVTVQTTDSTATGALAADNATLSLAAGEGQSSAVINLAGTFSAGSTVSFLGTIDGTNYFPIFGSSVSSSSISLVSSVAGGSGPYEYRVDVAGLAGIQVKVDPFQSGDSITTTLRMSVGTPAISAAAAAGTTIANQGSQGTIGQSWFTEITDGTNVLGTSSHPVRVDPTGTTTQPVSGTVAVTQTTSPWVTQDTSDGSVTGGTAGTTSLLGGGIYHTSAPTLTNGQQAALQLDVNGNLKVATSGSANASVGLTGSTAPTSATEIGGVDTNGNLNYPGITLANAGATTGQQGLVVTLSPNLPYQATSGGIGSNGGSLVLAGTQGYGNVTFAVRGTWVGTLQFQATVDGTNWFPVNALSMDPSAFPSAPPVSSISGTADNGLYTVPCASFSQVRLFASGWTSGTASCNVQGSLTSSVTFDTELSVYEGGTSVYNSGFITIVGGQSATGPNNAQALQLAPASTSAVSGQPALVVTLSPNSVNTVVQGTVAVSSVSGTVAVTQSTSPWITQDQADGSVTGGTAGSYSLLAGGIYHTAAPTLSNGNQAALQLDVNGNLKVVSSGGGSTLVADRIIGPSNITANHQSVTISAQGCGDIGINVSGTFVATLEFDGTIDGTNWFPVFAIPMSAAFLLPTPPVNETNGTGLWVIPAAGLAQIRVYSISYTSGTAVVTLEGNQASSINYPIELTAGANGQPSPSYGTLIAGEDQNSGNLHFASVIGGGGAAGSSQTALVVTVAPSSASLAVTGSGTFTTSDLADGSVGAGTAGTKSMLGGLVYNTSAPTLTNGQQVALQGDSSGNLKVGVQGSVAVTGTFWQATQPVSIASAVAVTQSTSPWIVAGGGTAGSPGTAVLTVQGIGGGTPIPVSFTAPTASATYRAATFNLNPAATPTDILTVQGSGTKTVTITRISISGTQTVAGAELVRLIVRSAADTGGTSTTVTAVPLDSNDAAATAVVKAYTVNPSALGTAVGDIEDVQAFITDGTAAPNVTVLNFGTGPSAQAAVLRGTSQFLALNLNGVTLTGAALSVSIEWTEA